MCCAVSVSRPGNFLLSVKADHRPVGNNQVAAIFAVMLGGHDALEELSARRFCRETMRPTIRRVFGHFYEVVPSMAMALFSPLESPYFCLHHVRPFHNESLYDLCNSIARTASLSFGISNGFPK